MMPVSSLSSGSDAPAPSLPVTCGAVSTVFLLQPVRLKPKTSTTNVAKCNIFVLPISPSIWMKFKQSACWRNLLHHRRITTNISGKLKNLAKALSPIKLQKILDFVYPFVIEKKYYFHE
jgi:hypothetical protein